MNKICPVCNTKMSYVKPVEGFTHFFLCSRNESTQEIDPTKGLPVQAYGCTNCGTIILHSDKLLSNK